MTLATLALITGIGLLGALVAVPARWRAPAVVGQLLLGAVVGRTGFGWLDPTDPVFTFLAELGFLLVMYVAGTHVPVRDPALRAGVLPALARAAVVGVASVGIAWLIARGFGTGHVGLYAVLLASSSAAVTLPTIRAFGLKGDPVLGLLPQVAVADCAAIVALPLVLAPDQVLRTALGAAGVIAAATVIWLALRVLDAAGWRRRVHVVSEERRLALELRLHLLLLFALAALAHLFGVSLMLAGFAVGLAVAGVGEPRRLTRQMFGMTEGFLGPLYFIWLGAGLDLVTLAEQPRMAALGLALGLGAVLAHLTGVLLRQKPAMAVLGSSQLGLPAAAVTVGAHVMAPGEAPAILLGALVTIVAVSVTGAVAAKEPRQTGTV